MAAIGAMLPRAHHASRQARFQQPPAAIYGVLIGPPDWRRGLKAWGPLPAKGGRTQWWEQDIHGQKIVFELVESQPPARRVVRIADQGLPWSGTWTFEIAPAGDGALVRISEDGEIYNVIFRFMARFFFGYTASIDGYLRDLAMKLGEPAPGVAAARPKASPWPGTAPRHRADD
jgi:hypothetical protein